MGTALSSNSRVSVEVGGRGLGNLTTEYTEHTEIGNGEWGERMRDVDAGIQNRRFGISEGHSRMDLWVARDYRLL